MWGSHKVNQDIVNVCIGAVFSAGGWVLNSLYRSVQDLQKKVSDIEVLVAGDYVKRDYLDRLATAVFEKLDKISDKIDKKADK